MAEHLLGLPLKHRHKDLKGIGPDDHHRRWGWADEQSWHRSFFFPYSYNSKIAGGVVDGWTRYAGNPILDYGQAGNWDADVLILNGVVLESDAYYLYYAGSITPVRDNAKIGLATSVDGYSFSRYGTDGKIIDPPSGFKSIYVGDVLYDDYESDGDKKWKALFRAMETGVGATPKHCLYYYSGDGKSWTYAGDITANLTNWDDNPCFIRVGNAYFVYYVDSANANMYLAVTKDFVTFSYYGSVLQGTVGAWDANVCYASIFWNLGVWYLFYSGKFSGEAWRIGMAVSSNGWNFTKYPWNPIFQHSGVNGAFDEESVSRPCVMMLQNKFALFYTGDVPTVFKPRIGRADIV